jgi:N-carbamoylputrescine amidase
LAGDRPTTMERGIQRMTSRDTMAARSVRLAAIQMPSRLGAIDENLARATTLAGEAAGRGARLLLFHELMPSGYAWDETAWSSAEPSQGPTAHWARELAGRLGVWLGTSFLEAEGEDFWNTFVLATPDATEAGRVRKEFPSMFEARVFRGDPGPHVIATALGNIGIAICFDAHAAAVARRLVVADVDLVLAPHCYCVPRRPSRTANQADIDRLVRNLAGIAPLYGRTLGVPTIVTNRVGDWDVPKGSGFEFVGQATIADSDGTVRAHLDREEGLAIADVCLDPGRRTRTAPPAFSRWIYPGPRGREVLRAIEWWEGRRYRRSRHRRRQAIAAAVMGPE